MDLFYFHYKKKRVLFQPFKNEKARTIESSHRLAPLTGLFSSPAGLWTVFTLGGGASKTAPAPAPASPLANQSLLLLLVLANLTDAADAPNPYRQAIMSFKNTQGRWSLSGVLPAGEGGHRLPRVVHCLGGGERAAPNIFMLIDDEHSLGFPACLLRQARCVLDGGCASLCAFTWAFLPEIPTQPVRIWLHLSYLLGMKIKPYKTK